MTTTMCPAVWGGKNRITRNDTEKWFHLYIGENDSNHGPSNDVCVVLSHQQLESLRGLIITSLAAAELDETAPAPTKPELTEK